MLPAQKQPLHPPLRADPHGELVRLKEKIWQRYGSLLALAVRVYAVIIVRVCLRRTLSNVRNVIVRRRNSGSGTPVFVCLR